MICLSIPFVSLSLLHVVLSDVRHMGYRPSLIYLGGANGFYVTKVTFSKDNIHLASVCDDR